MMSNWRQDTRTRSLNLQLTWEDLAIAKFWEL
jgi:hypothetical protein